MPLIEKNSALWTYISGDIRGLLTDGELLVDHVKEMPDRVSDYSYLVFPFSKAYEGFLKKLFLDLNLIKEDEYYGDDIRIGRILNPRFVHENENVFERLCSRNTKFAESLWEVWKSGRNEVFHYFPHNFKRLSYSEAMELVHKILDAMDDVVHVCYLGGD